MMSGGKVEFLAYFKGRAKRNAQDFFLPTRLWGPSEEVSLGSWVTGGSWGPQPPPAPQMTLGMPFEE